MMIGVVLLWSGGGHLIIIEVYPRLHHNTSLLDFGKIFGEYQFHGKNNNIYYFFVNVLRWSADLDQLVPIHALSGLFKWFRRPAVFEHFEILQITFFTYLIDHARLLVTLGLDIVLAIIEQSKSKKCAICIDINLLVFYMRG